MVRLKMKRYWTKAGVSVISSDTTPFFTGVSYVCVLGKNANVTNI